MRRESGMKIALAALAAVTMGIASPVVASADPTEDITLQDGQHVTITYCAEQESWWPVDKPCGKPIETQHHWYEENDGIQYSCVSIPRPTVQTWCDPVQAVDHSGIVGVSEDCRYSASHVCTPGNAQKALPGWYGDVDCWPGAIWCPDIDAPYSDARVHPGAPKLHTWDCVQNGEEHGEACDDVDNGPSFMPAKRGGGHGGHHKKGK